MASRLRSSPWIAFEDERLSFFPVALPGAAGLDVMCDVTSCLAACGVAWGKNEFEGCLCESIVGVITGGFGCNGGATRSGCGQKTLPEAAKPCPILSPFSIYLPWGSFRSISQKILSQSISETQRTGLKTNPHALPNTVCNFPYMLKRCQAKFSKRLVNGAKPYHSNGPLPIRRRPCYP